MTASIEDVPVRTLAGDETSLAQFRGKVLLIVNVASKCGLTPQYEGLEKLYQQYRDRGLVIAGFPSNNFAGQEPGTSDEIRDFCTLNFGVDFPMFEKITVVGEEKHPLYERLIAAQPHAIQTGETPFADNLRKYGISPNAEPEVLWNFEKFLVNRKGEVVRRFSPDTEPFNPQLIAAIEQELNAAA
ncbi:glutathione peroxidase [Acidobacteria bacterium AB60]|nr:glutathione peroxidase [Acidobacteria bacterium AB60]